MRQGDRLELIAREMDQPDSVITNVNQIGRAGASSAEIVNRNSKSAVNRMQTGGMGASSSRGASAAGGDADDAANGNGGDVSQNKGGSKRPKSTFLTSWL